MIIVQLIGGLGNQMFQYACGRHLALLNNSELKLDLSFLENRVHFRKDFVFRNFDLDLFNIQASIATNSDIPLYPATWRINSIPHRLYNLIQIKSRGYKYILERKLNSYNLMLYNDKILKLCGNIYLAGYWASPKYFDDIKEVIKRDFTFKKDLPADFNELKHKIITSESVCISVRRKEFLVVKQMGFHGMDYIHKAVNHITQQVTSPVFFVFSDDLDWCREYLKLPFSITYVGEEYHGDRFGDYLHLMSLCRHFIIPNSTFAWWGAWLSDSPNKIVIVPQKLFIGYNDKDYVPDSWTRA